MDKEIKLNHKFILSITLVAALGGLLFGYDWVVIGGAKPFYERFFEITDSPNLQGWGMSSALIGCLLGALSSGYISDRLGRKLPLISAASLFVIAAIGTGAASDFTMFVFYRLIGGLGIGLASATSPLYIAEISPANFRGRLVSLNQLTIVIGILAAQLVNFQIADQIPPTADDEFIRNSWNGQMGWRWMFWVGSIPALVFLILSFFIPESPRFHAKIGNWSETNKTLTRIGGTQYAIEQEPEIFKTLQESGSKINWKALKSKNVRLVLFIGIVLSVLQQWCGINVIFNYADEIFTTAGYSINNMLFNIVITGAINLIFTVISIRIIDKWGRRNLMLLGFTGLSIIYFLLGTCYFLEVRGFIILIVVMIAIAIYAMTLAPVIWVVLSEVFPNKVRGLAMAIATSALWIACFILTYTFPILHKLFGAGGTFWLYAFICISGCLYVYKKLPETKGRTLEEVEAILKNVSQ